MKLAVPRKVYQGVADRRQMFRMFDRHAQRPNRWSGIGGDLYAGEWFEIGGAEHDYMLNVLPPLWMKPQMFAMREFLTGSITSVFFAIPIDGVARHFHGYCDLADPKSPEKMRNAIIERERERESRPIRSMTRQERLEHIWSITSDDYRGYADACWPEAQRGQRKIVICGGGTGPSSKLLDDLTDCEISSKLPVHLRYLPEPQAA